MARNFTGSMRRFFLTLSVFCWSVSSGTNVQACGPFLSETILDLSYAILRAPNTSFDLEMSWIATLPEPLPGNLKLPDELQSFRQNGKPAEGIVDFLFNSSGADLISDKDGCRTRLLASNSQLARDVAEVALFLKEGEQVEDYRAIRTGMLSDQKRARELLPPDEWNRVSALIAKKDWPGYLPKEFQLYLDGAVAYSAKQWDVAAASFDQILALPLEERRYRSIWATYMRGRTELKRGDVDLKNSIVHFRRVLKEREAGYHDSLDMGWESLRIVADHQELNGGDLNEILRHRFAVAWYGKGPVSPILDFKRWTRSLMEDDRAMEISRGDSFARRIFTATRLASFEAVKYWENEEVRSDPWLEFLKTTRLSQSELPNAAHLAYLSGDTDQAGTWLRQYSGADVRASWLRGKLLAKAGQVRQASREIAKAESEHKRPLDGEIPEYRDGEGRSWNSTREEVSGYRTSQYWGERGILDLANDRYTDAMEDFLRSGHWRDAAYVAEQLLSREELLVYVRDRWPSHQSSVDDELSVVPYRMRYLTARRLARDRYFKDARDLFPPELLPVFDKYVESYRLFRDESYSEEERAGAGWDVAQIHRRLGMELFGTEVGPDFTCWSGTFGDWGSGITMERLNEPGQARVADRVDHYRNPLVLKERDLLAEEEKKDREGWEKDPVFPTPTPSEKWRFRNYAKLPNVFRFHYRHVAADLAWEASKLMPGESEDTAQVLSIAGSWLSTKYPKHADVFYKSLVIRNRTTPTGHLADMQRWFPGNNWREDYNPWLSLWLPNPERRDFLVPAEFSEREEYRGY